jgi:hypothetical protein
MGDISSVVPRKINQGIKRKADTAHPSDTITAEPVGRSTAALSSGGGPGLQVKGRSAATSSHGGESGQEPPS